MIRAVLDANVLASGAVASRGTLVDLIEAWQRGAYDVVLSAEILGELESTLAKPYFASRLEVATVAAFLALVRSLATVVPITTPVPNVAVTRADNLILATAESGRVPFLVTGDRELQELGRYRGVTILSPRAFLDRITGDADEGDR